MQKATMGGLFFRENRVLRLRTRLANFFTNVIDHLIDQIRIVSLPPSPGSMARCQTRE